MQAFTLLSSFEKKLWMTSLAIVTVSSLAAGVAILNLLASLVGVTALIFMAKGHVWGQLLTIAFALLYAVISFQYAYYGEMITYLGMTAPMAAVAAVAWLKNPAEAGSHQVAVAEFTALDTAKLVVFTTGVTIAFYFILAYFSTENLPLSTLSVATSFAASYLTYRRSPFYALAYALNDLVLIGLWLLATWEHLPYLTMVVCFTMFFLNDLYAFYNWRIMARTQQR